MVRVELLEDFIHVFWFQHQECVVHISCIELENASIDQIIDHGSLKFCHDNVGQYRTQGGTHTNPVCLLVDGSVRKEGGLVTSIEDQLLESSLFQIRGDQLAIINAI